MWLRRQKEAPAATAASDLAEQVSDPAFSEKNLTPEELQMVNDFSEKIDLHNSQAILQYGVGTQKKMADFSEAALNNVRTKDLGEVGDMLSSLVVDLKSFDITEQDKGFKGLFKKSSNKITAMKAKYDKAEVNVNNVCTALENHQVTLMKDIALLDKMYAVNLTYFKELSMYILAGKKKLERSAPVSLPLLLQKQRPLICQKMHRLQKIYSPCVTVLKRKSMIWS